MTCTLLSTPDDPDRGGALPAAGVTFDATTRRARCTPGRDLASRAAEQGHDAGQQQPYPRHGRTPPTGRQQNKHGRHTQRLPPAAGRTPACSHSCWAPATIAPPARKGGLEGGGFWEMWLADLAAITGRLGVPATALLPDPAATEGSG